MKTVRDDAQLLSRVIVLVSEFDFDVITPTHVYLTCLISFV